MQYFHMQVPARPIDRSTFLHNSSQIFNIKRIMDSKQQLASEQQRMKRVLGFITSVVSQEIKSGQKSGLEEMLKKEQHVISNLIQWLKNLKVGLEDCEKAHKKARTTDLCPEDEKFLVQVLFEHGLINERYSEGGIAKILQSIRANEEKEKLRLKEYKGEESEQQAGEQEQQEEDLQNPENIALQNYRTSRFPLGYNICSIDCQMMNVGQNLGKCSLQLDLGTQEDIEKIHKKASKRYENEGVIMEDQIPYQTLDLKKSTKSSPRETLAKNKQVVCMRSNQDKLATKCNSKKKQNEKFQQGEGKRKLSRVFNRIQLSNFQTNERDFLNIEKSRSSKKEKEIIHEGKYKRLETSRSNWKEENYPQISMGQIGDESFFGKLGVFDYEIHFSSIHKISLQNGKVILDINPLGLLETEFKDYDQARKLPQCLHQYSLKVLKYKKQRVA